MSAPFQSAIEAIDAANAGDPRMLTVDGQSRAFEIVYSERMSQCLDRLYPDASELLGIAARAQHIRRWEIARSDYPLGRDGYNAWRKACREHHAKLVTAILLRTGYANDDAERVSTLIRKEHLKTNFESQALENVAGVVFFEYYLNDFLIGHSDYDEAKLAGIISKTLRKMSSDGHAAILALPLSPSVRALIDKIIGNRVEAAKQP